MASVEINYLAVLVCGVLSMVTGGLWYGPILGKAWLKAVNKSEEELMKDFNMARTYTLAVLGHFLLALILAYLLDLTQATTISDGIRIAMTLGIGIVFSTMFINSLFERKKLLLVLINSGFQTINLIIFSIILILW